MSEEHVTSSNSPDLIRWTFDIDPNSCNEIEAYLLDLGLEVFVREPSQIVAIWDEPEGNLDEVVEAIWAIHGEPFEITHEEFHRRNLLQIYHEDDHESPGSERAVA
jgi:hypothetical protein